jgi:putative heme-binding domain-containing protein
LLRDADIRIRRAAVTLCGKLNKNDSADLILKYAESEDRLLISASLEALHVFNDRRAMPAAIQALQFPETQLDALSYLSDLGDSSQLAAVIAAGEKSRSMETLAAVIRTLTTWQRKSQLKAEDAGRIERSIAALQGASGALLRWHIRGPLNVGTADEVLKNGAVWNLSDTASIPSDDWEERNVHGTDAQLHLRPANGSSDSEWLAISDVDLAQAEEIEFLASANGTFEVWLTGRSVYRRPKALTYQPDSDRFAAQLPKGTSRIAVRISGTGDHVPFHLRFRRKSSQADHERLTQLALAGKGNVQRGRELFLNAEKSLCIKCHRLADQGGRVGPDLSAIGSRFSRVHLIESLLEPSRTVAPSYETWSLVLASGRLLSGVKLHETVTELTLGDNQGQTHQLPKASIEEIHLQPTSLMPDDVYKRLTDNEFVDLIEFLTSLTKKG